MDNTRRRNDDISYLTQEEVDEIIEQIIRKKGGYALSIHNKQLETYVSKN